MNAGTLSEQVVITEVTSQLGNYRFYYSCYESMESDENRWMKEAVNADTNTHAYFEACEIEDIPTGASVTIYGTNTETPVVLNVDLEEQVKELGEDKTLSFTIKVPADQYDADATYTVVRNHVTADGATSMDVLETIREGDVLTFASDKFSTFVLWKLQSMKVQKM